MHTQQHQIPTTLLVLDNNIIKRLSCVRDLGIYIDSDTSKLKTHDVSKAVSCCFSSSRQNNFDDQSANQQTIEKTGLHNHQIRAKILLKWPRNVAQPEHYEVSCGSVSGEIRRAAHVCSHES